MQEQQQLLEELKANADADKQAAVYTKQQAHDAETRVITLQSQNCTLQDALDEARTACAPRPVACTHAQTDAFLLEPLTAEACHTATVHTNP